MNAPSAAVAYARAHEARFVRELQSFVRFPSVTADPRRRDDVRRCASWLRAQLESAGLRRAELVPTEGHPLVRAEWRSGDAGGERRRPTLLVYGHYDVQPAAAADGWHSPPFAAELRHGAVVGRGASDDKGQLLAHVKAIESCLRTSGTLPVDVVCLFEGEEEAGSGALLGFLERTGAPEVDVAVVSDTPMRGRDRPAITYALRGTLSLELDVWAAPHDLHAGTFGGVLPGAAGTLCSIVAALHDGSSGRVAVPGFYDRVRPIAPRERAALARAAPTVAELRAAVGAPAARRETEFSPQERATIRPSLTVSGIGGGFAGPGGKGVIPAHASAKLDLRIVPDQQPAEIERLIRRHLARLAPPGVRTRLRLHYAASPAFTDPRHPAVRAAARAYARVFGSPPVLLRAGGTIPVVSMLSGAFGIPVVLAGFALPGDGAHAPDEHFSLDAFSRAIETCIHFMTELGSGGVPRRAAARRRGAPTAWRGAVPARAGGGGS